MKYIEKVTNLFVKGVTILFNNEKTSSTMYEEVCVLVGINIAVFPISVWTRTIPLSTYFNWPFPLMMYLVEVKAFNPIGPRACSFWVLIPISAPKPNSKPSVNRVEAL